MSSWVRYGIVAALFAVAASRVATVASAQDTDMATPNLQASATPDLDPPLKHIPLSSLKATRERPLFSPSRRPPEVTIAEPAAAPAPPPPPPPPPTSTLPRPNLTLVGTVMSGKRSLAIFTDAATQDTIRLHMGEVRDGWTLASIDRRAATLTNGDEAFTIEFPAAVESTETAEPASDDDTPPPAWQVRHQAAATADTQLQSPPGSAPAPLRPPPPPPTLRRRFHP